MNKKLFIILLLFMSLFVLSSCDGKTPSESDNKSQSSAVSDSETDTSQDESETSTESETEASAILGGEHDVRIFFVNAGKADSIAIELDGKFHLIDTGKTISVPAIYAALDYLGCKTVEGLYITHSDKDHVGGIEHVLSRYEVLRAYRSNLSLEPDKIDEPLGSLTPTQLKNGEFIELADGVYFEVLAPIRLDNQNDNNNSLVLRMKVNGRTILFAADMEISEEAAVISTGGNLKCDILKVAHHGRDDSSSWTFVDKTSPLYAIVSTDRKADDRTANEMILNLYKNNGAEVLVTDESEMGYLCTIDRSGNIKVENVPYGKKTDGVTLESVSKSEQRAVIKNSSAEKIDLTGWAIISTEGEELYLFPDGTVISAGGTVAVAGKGDGREGDLIWDEKNPWKKKNPDTAILVDKYGREVSRFDSK